MDARARRRLAEGEDGLGSLDGEGGDGLVDADARVNGIRAGLDVAEFDVPTADVGYGRVPDEGDVRPAVSLDPRRFEIHFDDLVTFTDRRCVLKVHC